MTTRTAKKKVVKKTTKKIVKKAPAKKPTVKHGNSKWDETLIPIIKNLAYRGKTHSDIAELLGITEATFYLWKAKYTELFEALEEAKGCPIKKVEAALFERAVGYSCRETKTHITKSGVVKTKDIIKHYPPSETAQKYYLGNKDSKNWKDKREVDLGGDSNTPKRTFAFSLDVEPETGEEEPNE